MEDGNLLRMTDMNNNMFAIRKNIIYIWCFVTFSTTWLPLVLLFFSNFQSGLTRENWMVFIYMFIVFTGFAFLLLIPVFDVMLTTFDEHKVERKNIFRYRGFDWKMVDKIEIKGFSLLLHAHPKKISVNLFFYVHPDAIVEFVRKHTKHIDDNKYLLPDSKL
jgi:hypothetical protein